MTSSRTRANCAPYECCGLLAGRENRVTHLYRIKNIVALRGREKQSPFDPDKAAHLERLSPEERAEIAFVMDMQEFSFAKKDIRNNGLVLQVVYHSHPKDPARPSVTDIKISQRLRRHLAADQSPRSRLSSRVVHEQPAADIRTYWIKTGHVRRLTFYCLACIIHDGVRSQRSGGRLAAQ